MNDTAELDIPPLILEIERATIDSGFTMASDYQTGSILRTLVATKTNGKILELGTGTGLSTCWLLEGMDSASTLVTVDSESEFVDIAKSFLASDPRVKFFIQDGTDFLRDIKGRRYDFIFADTWPGKYWDFKETLNLLSDGGIYLIDDMLPQDNWPEDHAPKVSALIETIESLEGFKFTKLAWSTGVIVISKSKQPSVADG